MKTLARRFLIVGAVLALLAWPTHQQEGRGSEPVPPRHGRADSSFDDRSYRRLRTVAVAFFGTLVAAAVIGYVLAVIVSWEARRDDDTFLAVVLRTFLETAPFQQTTAFPAPPDAFQALGAIATVGVAIVFYDERLVLPDTSDTEEEHERFVSVLQSKALLQAIAYLVAISAWIVGVADTTTLAGLVRTFVSICIAALAANFIASRREEARVLSILRQKRAESLSILYAKSLDQPGRPRGSTRRFYLLSLPALAAATWLLWATRDSDFSGYSLGFAIFAVSALTIFPIVGTYNIIRMYAEIVVDPARRHGRRFYAGLSVLFLIIPNIIASSSFVYYRLVDDAEISLRYLVLFLLPVVGYLPLIFGGRQLYRRRREAEAREQAALAATQPTHRVETAERR